MMAILKCENVLLNGVDYFIEECASMDLSFSQKRYTSVYCR